MDFNSIDLTVRVVDRVSVTYESDSISGFFFAFSLVAIGYMVRFVLVIRVTTVSYDVFMETDEGLNGVFNSV